MVGNLNGTIIKMTTGSSNYYLVNIKDLYDGGQQDFGNCRHLHNTYTRIFNDLQIAFE